MATSATRFLPGESDQLQVDPDPKLEKEAEQTAQRVMSGGELGIQRMSKTELHVQRLPEEKLFVDNHERGRQSRLSRADEVSDL